MSSGYWGVYCWLCEEAVVVMNSTYDEIEEAWETHESGAVHKAGGYLPPEEEDDLSLDETDSIRDDYMRGPPPANYHEPPDHPVFEFIL